MVENKNYCPKEIVLKSQLQTKWQSFCEQLQVPPQEQVFENIIKSYSEPQRHYHTLNHLSQCLNEFETVKSQLANPEAVEMALWFHDSVYQPGQKDNEEKSAADAVSFIKKIGLDDEFGNQVSELILSTKHINPTANLDSQYLNDIDMSILGQNQLVFDQYDSQIQKEFTAFYPLEKYEQGRLAFFKSVLSRKPIYSTTHFQNKYESVAIQNIERTITKLEN